MLILVSVILVLCIFQSSLAAPATKRQGRACSNKLQRRAWHTLSQQEKNAYIGAELCLMNTRATLGLPGARTVFDEFQLTHVLQAWDNHFTGSFLPFHRMLIHTHEQLLRSRCGYHGAQPYWQEENDAGRFSTSSMIQEFGGNGQGGSACINGGPFRRYVNPVGPGWQFQDHCIDRQINDAISFGAAITNVNACFHMPTFMDFWPCLEGLPHSAGHNGIGREMSNGVSSPGDPLFYLHHTWLDKIWANWQDGDRGTRLRAIGGSNGAPPNSPIGIRPASLPVQNNRAGDNGDTVTLNHVLDMKGLLPSARVSDVMDIAGGFLCYEYV